MVVNFVWVGKCSDLRVLLAQWKRMLAWDSDLLMPFD